MIFMAVHFLHSSLGTPGGNAFFDYTTPSGHEKAGGTSPPASVVPIL
jgi:hypothetical protein